MNSNRSTKINFGDKLRQLRNQKGYSQEHVSEFLNVSQKTYSNMENDKSSISIEALKEIALLYEIDLLELLQENRIIQHNNSKDTSTIQGVVHNHVSKELINQFKERISDLKGIIEKKDEQIARLENLLFKK